MKQISCRKRSHSFRGFTGPESLKQTPGAGVLLGDSGPVASEMSGKRVWPDQLSLSSNLLIALVALGTPH